MYVIQLHQIDKSTFPPYIIRVIFDHFFQIYRVLKIISLHKRKVKKNIGNIGGILIHSDKPISIVSGSGIMYKNFVYKYSVFFINIISRIKNVRIFLFFIKLSIRLYIIVAGFYFVYQIILSLVSFLSSLFPEHLA